MSITKQEWRKQVYGKLQAVVGTTDGVGGGSLPPASFSPTQVGVALSTETLNIPPALDLSVDGLIRFREYKKKLANSFILLTSRTEPGHGMMISRSNGSRYFAGGRRKAQRNIRKRLGTRWFSPGVMLTLTFNPAKFSRPGAWSKVSEYRHKLMNTINERRRKDGHKAYKNVWAIEAMPEYKVDKRTGERHYNNPVSVGFPHIHIFFPGLHYLAPASELRELWAYGRIDVEYKDNVNVASYCCKYIAKLEGWPEVAQAILWQSGRRVYGYSTIYTLPYSDMRVPAQWAFQCTYKRRDGVPLLVSGYTDIILCNPLGEDTPFSVVDSLTGQCWN